MAPLTNMLQTNSSFLPAHVLFVLSNFCISKTLTFFLNWNKNQKGSISVVSNKCNQSNMNDSCRITDYEIPKIVSWISCLGIKKVALQFPDELLVDGPDVALKIGYSCDVQVYIIGDTSYGR